MTESKKNRINIIQAITSPLGFFVLSLLIVEGFLAVVLIASNLDPHDKYIGMIIGAFLFVIIVILVFCLVWKKPTNLTFGEKSHLQLQLQQLTKNRWGTSDKPETEFKIEQENIIEPKFKS